MLCEGGRSGQWYRSAALELMGPVEGSILAQAPAPRCPQRACVREASRCGAEAHVMHVEVCVAPSSPMSGGSPGGVLPLLASLSPVGLAGATLPGHLCYSPRACCAQCLGWCEDN